MQSLLRSTLLAAAAASLTACVSPAPAPQNTDFTVLAWNIWHGGREDGETAGPKKVIDVIRSSGADLVAMQETYGSGDLISAALGYHFVPRGTNVSIHSRYPIVEDVSVFAEFKCVGAIVELPKGHRLAFYSLWLPYDEEIWAEGTREGKSKAQLLAACASSATDLAKIVDLVHKRLDLGGYGGVPVVFAGDFNSMSHLDYNSATRDQFGDVIAWPTSRVMTTAGYRDTYREVHPDVDRQRDRTWTPRFPDQQQDRIDFVYVSRNGPQVTTAEVLESHPMGFPSDHAAVRVGFRWR